MTKSVEATFESGRKETKNKVVYDEIVKDGEQSVIGALYVSRFAVQQLGSPSKLTIRIQPETS